MNLKRYKIMTFLAVISAMSGCGTDIEPESTLRTPIVPVVVPDIETRGSAVTTESLTAFKMTAYANGQWYDNTIPAWQQGSKERPNQAGLYFEGANVTKDGDEWVMDPVQYWLNGVNNDLSLRFWSWCGSAEPETSVASLFGTAGFSGYTVAENVQSQEDLIYAYNAETRKFDSEGNIQDGKDNTVSIHFYHALSEISFDVSGVSEDLYVSNIALNNVYGKGDCSMKETDGADGIRLYFTWSNLSTPTTYSQAFTESDFNSEGLMVTGTTKKMYLIPQELTDDVTISVTFSPKGGGEAGSPITKSISMNVSTRVKWKPGKYYLYRLKFSGSGDLVLTGSLDVYEPEWF